MLNGSFSNMNSKNYRHRIFFKLPTSIGNLVFDNLMQEKPHVQWFVFSQISTEWKHVWIIDLPQNVPTRSCPGGRFRNHHLRQKNVFIHPPMSYIFLNANTTSFTWNTIQNFQDERVNPTGRVKSGPIDFKKWFFGALRDTGPISGCKCGMTPYGK